MQVALRLVAVVVLALIAYACARRSDATPPGANSPAELIADPDDPIHATIAGVVIGEHSGEGVAGVPVRLEGAGSAGPIEVTSGVDGSFVFPALAPGSYTVRIAGDAAAAAAVHGASVGAGQRWRPRLVVDEAVELEPAGASIRARGRVG